MAEKARPRYTSLPREPASPTRVPYTPEKEPRTGQVLSLIPRETDKDDANLKRFKNIKLFWLFMSASAWAFNRCIDGPTVPDMRERLGLSMEEFSRSSASNSLGWIIGALIGGLICDRWLRYSDLVVAVSLMGLGTTLCIKPWSTNLSMLCILQSISGVFGGSLNTGTSAIHFGLFGAESLPMFVRGLGWPLSCPLVPLIAKNFLSDPLADLHGNGTMNYSLHPALGPWWSYGDNSRIEIPYAMCSIVAFVVAPAFFYYHFKGPPSVFIPQHKEKTSWKEVCSPGSCAKGSSCFSLTMTIGLIIYFILYDASNMSRWNLSFSYTVDPRAPLNMTKDTASYLSSVGSFSILASRLFCIGLQYWVPTFRIQTLMAICVSGHLLFTAVYVFAGLKNSMVLWTSTIIVDLFMQPLWLGGYLWTENYMHVYALIVGLTDTGVGVASLSSSWVYGKLFDIDPALPFHISFIFTCLFSLNFAGMQVIASYYTRKRKRTPSDSGEASQALLLSEDESDDDEDQVELEVVNGKVRYLRDSGAVASSEGEDFGPAQ